MTSATNSAITASQPVSFTVPAVQALTLSTSPATFSTTPGTAVNSTLTLQSAGNVPVTAALAATGDSNLSISGLSPSITLGVGQSTTQNLLITPGVNAPLTTPLNAAITATFGIQQSAPANLTIQVNALQAIAAATGASSATALGRIDIASTLSGPGARSIRLWLPVARPRQQAVIDYINNLIQEMNAPSLSNFTAQLQTASSAITQRQHARTSALWH